MNKILILLLILIPGFCIADTYEYKLESNSKTRILKVPKETINKYPGWYFSGKPPITMMLSYPEMTPGNYEDKNWLSLSVKFYSDGSLKRTLEESHENTYCDLDD